MKKHIILLGMVLLISMMSIMAFAAADYTVAKISKKGIGYTLNIKFPVFTEGTALAKAINKDIAKVVNTHVKEFQKIATGAHSHTYTLVSDYEVSFSDNKIKSAIVYFDEYTGGAHNNPTSYAATYAVVNGKVQKYNVSDFITDKNKLSQKVVANLNAQKREKGLDTISSFDQLLLRNYVITPKGVKWIFDPYAVGPYSEGRYKVSIPWTGLEDILKVDNAALIKSINKVDANKKATTVTSNTAPVSSGDGLNVYGTIHINNNEKVPAGSTLKISLLLNDKQDRVLESYTMPFTGNDMPFNVTLKTKLDDNNQYGYEMFFEILNKQGKRVFMGEQETHISSIGWMGGEVIPMQSY